MTQRSCRSYHKYKAIHEPRCNCIPCWDKYFCRQVARTWTAVKAMRELGAGVVCKVKGDKFMKQLQRFLETEQGEKLNGSV